MAFAAAGCLMAPAGRDAAAIELVFFFQAEDGIRALYVTGVQTCALPICGGADCELCAEQAQVRRHRDCLCATAGAPVPIGRGSPPAAELGGHSGFLGLHGIEDPTMIRPLATMFWSVALVATLTAGGPAFRGRPPAIQATKHDHLYV